ncbi:MAG: hypothetical protein QXY07_03195 [Candidatus Bathyarchaeia archaeon]
MRNANFRLDKPMPAFQQIVLDKTHHQNVQCCRCGRRLKPGQRVWRHQSKYETRYYCPTSYKALWH